MTTIRYTLKDQDITGFDLARWVKQKWSKVSASDALTIARALKAGEGWEPPHYVLNEPEAEGPCEFVVIEPPNEWQEYHDRQNALHKLMLKGAEGDAEAAIAYCQAERDHRVSHGGMA